jgi:hypothetical protein
MEGVGKMNYFVTELSPIHNKYVVLPNHTALGLTATRGSYAVLGARLFGLSYANYLRLCRDNYNATLTGKKSLYINMTFTNKDDAEKLAKELSRRAAFFKRKKN